MRQSQAAPAHPRACGRVETWATSCGQRQVPEPLEPRLCRRRYRYPLPPSRRWHQPPLAGGDRHARASEAHSDDETSRRLKLAWSNSPSTWLTLPTSKSIDARASGMDVTPPEPGAPPLPTGAARPGDIAGTAAATERESCFVVGRGGSYTAKVPHGQAYANCCGQHPSLEKSPDQTPHLVLAHLRCLRCWISMIGGNPPIGKQVRSEPRRRVYADPLRHARRRA